ncbi:AzlD domain-containing protein [Clostridium ganghwense]|uniref:AzlD domain-containing protein n=1 Tax=Clostridium ganghwense TaxID=312089 RepID=A0ABT4CQJ8_9CLOT|nr:AzlD domain-containing protein [Clostridium ganghwense]MCY6371329.1 AzlD domain-containing protein [Clostridium ganghwense]
MTSAIGIVVLMALVTYIPRAAPMILLNNKKLSPFLKAFLKFIPFAALGALIFPQVLYSTGSIKSAIAGCLAALVCAFFRLNVIIVIFAGILGVFMYELI